jgi:hypothetical protein
MNTQAPTPGSILDLGTNTTPAAVEELDVLPAQVCQLRAPQHACPADGKKKG